jgi:Sulfatase-modifying factor enzyme 1/Rhamnogalacturonan I lyases beta-sheet domain
MSLWSLNAGACCLLLFSLLQPVRGADEFVPVKGGAIPGKPDVRVDAFEILNHPVTNDEYGKFTAATGHPAPLHWEGGRIPPGTQNWPVVFVNREDVYAYMTWRSRSEGRVYRLPTLAEFEFAGRAGSAEALYPWGSAPASGKANFDPDGTRSVGDWQKYIKPVKSYPPNALGLYDMAGNVAQMVLNYPDLTRTRYIFRLESPGDLDDMAVGGCWSRPERFLRFGAQFRVRSGLRRPDVGFRPVRAPLETSHFQQQRRRVIAAPAGANAVYIGWQLLPEDNARTAFHVYRSMRRDAAGERITTEPVRTSTNYLDRKAQPGKRAYYRVRPVGADGREGPPSEWAGAVPSQERDGLIAVFEPTVQQGGFTPVFGDLDGDGILDAVVKLDNGITEMSRDPGVSVELEALTSIGNGSALWRRPLVDHAHCYGNANNVPVVVYDLDGKGRDQVIVRLQEGDSVYLAVLDGLTGRVLRKTPWTEMVTDRTITSSRIHMAIAYLDGRHPSIITQTGLYENEVIDAFDANLKRLWTYKSFGATSGSGSHKIVIADVDGDGKDEVFDGTTLLNPDGTMRWSTYLEHADIVQVSRILPDTHDRQVFFGVESTRPGVYVVDARSGKLIWKRNEDDDPRWKHVHTGGWAADIWEGSPGLEILAYCNGTEDPVLLSSTGKFLADPMPGVQQRWWPLNWTGAATRELMSSDGKVLARFNGKGITNLPLPGPNARDGRCVMAADLVGDFRDEVVCMGTTKQGRRAIFVYSNVEPADRRDVTRLASREYRLWLARNLGAGYGSYFEWQP